MTGLPGRRYPRLSLRLQHAGRAGTLTLQIVDINGGSVVSARWTSGIVELVAEAGIYRATRPALTDGMFALIWGRGHPGTSTRTATPSSTRRGPLSVWHPLIRESGPQCAPSLTGPLEGSAGGVRVLEQFEASALELIKVLPPRRARWLASRRPTSSLPSGAPIPDEPVTAIRSQIGNARECRPAGAGLRPS